MSARRAALLLMTLTSASLAGCSSDLGAAGGAPTFHADVEPLLQRSCLGCHTPGGVAPFSLARYDDAKRVAGLIAKVTRERTMPPWGAFETDECRPRHGWEADLRLSDEEVATIDAWSAGGALEGERAPSPAHLAPGSAELRGAQLELAPEAPFVAAGESDQFRCFVLDPKLSDTRYLNGWSFLVGNPEIVHHALVFLDARGDSEALAGPDGSYDCFGGPRIEGGVVAAWAPGSLPFDGEPHIGAALPAGARLVMQVHYHPAGATAAPDMTRFQMRFTPSRPEYEMLFALLGNYSRQFANGDGLQPGPADERGATFRIPADARDHVEAMRFTLPATMNGQPTPDLHVHSIGAHMHYAGIDVKMDIEHASGAPGQETEECLLQVPSWDLTWQRLYRYAAAVEDLPRVAPGDALKVRCTYDNSLDNPHLLAALRERRSASPVDVLLGETALDEMCLARIAFVYRAR
ncbi:hypothetical protein WMF37_20485 [Sorangium sp. So ce291]|uniref:hypothetical protein n=1 Tax=Sorangium sp. So ce291 TaxID=3133294 RepID=UPI003F60B0A1